MTIAVISDIVGSRTLPDRALAQRELDGAISRVEHDLPLATQPLRITVGDEEQGTYANLDDALASLLLLQLVLPDSIQCRFGIGVGEVRTVDVPGGAIDDGPGWWAARKAIDTVHRTQQRAAPSARTWVVVAPGEDAVMHTVASFANAYLLARDEIVSGMSERTRRLVYGRCLRVTQRELAAAEGITQPGVSQALAGAGAGAVIEGFFALRSGARS
jgi:hypothetical protein